MGGPLVSVLIPTYRRPGFLREALKSVLMQQGVALQIIVGDNGSLGADVVSEFADRRIQYIGHAENVGMAGNWNHLLDAARTPYVALLMDDDRYLPGFLASAVTALEADSQIGVAFTNHLIDRHGEHRCRPSLLSAGTHQSFASTLIESNPVALCASVMRRDAWQQVRLLPDTGAADLVLFGRLAERGWAFHYIDEPLMIYRSHQGGYSAGLTFRDDVVRAWESLVFSDPATDAARQRQLAGSLVSRAAGRVQSGDRALARADLAKARTLGHPSSVRTILLEVAAVVPAAGRGGHHAKRLGRAAREQWLRRAWLRRVPRSARHY